MSGQTRVRIWNEGVSGQKVWSPPSPLGASTDSLTRETIAFIPWDKISKDELMEDLRSVSSSRRSGEGALGAVT